MIPNIPNGIADRILKNKFGKNSVKLGDILLSKIAAELTLTEIDQRLGKNNKVRLSIVNEIAKLEKTIESYVKYLKTWYESYFQLATQCNGCERNELGEYCSFYGKGKIPLPNYPKTNEKCIYRVPQRRKKTYPVK